jgi:hypothetical protein
VCLEAERVDVPAGQRCQWCEQGIASDDRGFLVPFMDEDGATLEPWHLRCMIEAIGGPMP